MNSVRNRMLVIAAVALAAICANAAPAAAQAAFQGSFTLPHEVRWQGDTLPAGDYTFRMDSVGTSRIILRGPNGAEFVTALVADQDKVSQQSCLTIVHRGGNAIVSDLYLAQIGKRLRYSVPKAPKEVELAKADTTERILIAMK